MNRTDPSEIKHHLLRNLLILFISITAAIILAKSGVLENILFQSQTVKIIGNFLAGFFFTSVITIGPATIAIAELAQHNSIFPIAIIGAAGAVIGDLIIFKFVKNTITDDFIALFEKPKIHRLVHLLRLEMFRWLLPVIGALIIASPLPDEIGLAMMGISKMKLSVFIPLSFVMNFISVLIVVLAVKAI